METGVESIQETGEALDETYPLEVPIDDLRTQVEYLTEQYTESERKVFSLSCFASDDKSIKFYTGLPRIQVFNALYDFCNSGEQCENFYTGHGILHKQVKSPAVMVCPQSRTDQEYCIQKRNFFLLCVGLDKDLLKSTTPTYMEFPKQR